MMMIWKQKRAALALGLAFSVMLGACAQAEIIAADTDEEPFTLEEPASPETELYTVEEAEKESGASAVLLAEEAVAASQVQTGSNENLVELIIPAGNQHGSPSDDAQQGNESGGSDSLVELITPAGNGNEENGSGDWQQGNEPSGSESQTELITPAGNGNEENGSGDGQQGNEPGGSESQTELITPAGDGNEENGSGDGQQGNEPGSGASQTELITPADDGKEAEQPGEPKADDPQQTGSEQKPEDGQKTDETKTEETKKDEEEPQTQEVPVQAPQLASLSVRNVTLKSPKSPEPEKKGSISGTVGVEGSAKVTVTLTCKDPIVLRTKTCTSSEPSFTFDGLDAGEYTLTLYYEGIEGPVLTLTRIIKEEEDPVEPEKKPITITGVTPGENKIVIKGTAEPKTELKAGTEPSSVEATITSDKDGAFTATLICSAKEYTAVWVQYGADKTTRTKLEGKFIVTDEEMDKYPTFRRGDRYDPLIYRLQQRLADLGYYTIRVDGIYGSGTERAVRLFQQINGLKATGIADSATQVRLYSKSAKSLYDRIPGGTGYTLYRSNYYQAAVVPLQRRLRELGYYSGAADGYFGSATYRAVRNFQSRNGLAVTGAADPATQARLYSASAKAASSSPSGGSSTGYRLLYWGCKGDAVIRLQRALLNAGYTQVRSADGIYGKWTYDGVRAFQRDHGLAVDGIAGRKTQNALYGTHY